MSAIRVAVVGVGEFGRNHLRLCHELPGVQLTAAVDSQPDRAAAAAAEYSCAAYSSVTDLAGLVDAAILAVPTISHADVGCQLLAAGIDLLVEKPIAADEQQAQRLIDTARAHGRILQVGHLERFNPAVSAVQALITVPLFFEIHRLSLFTPRSLDVDVVLDLMIHDIDLVLRFTGELPEEVRAAGISILSEKVDIANVRLAFPSGCVANITASRVSTEKVRKMRLFQPHQYISLDYTRQDGIALTVSPERQIGFQPLAIAKDEPLRRELASFFASVRTRQTPAVTGEQGLEALKVCRQILDKIEEHSQLVASRLAR